MFDKPFQRSRFCPRRMAAATAAVVALAFGGSALGQPAGGTGGFGGHGGPHAMGPGGGDEMLGHLIEHAKSKLNLNTSQNVVFEANVTQTKAAHETGRALHQKVKDAMAVELAKTEPDLAAVSAVADGVQQQGMALRRQVRDAWLQLYATFSPEQKGIVRDLLQQRMARMESFRQKMKERITGGGG